MSVLVFVSYTAKVSYKFILSNNMIEKIMYLYRKYRDEIIFGKLLENLLDMKKPPKKSVVFILRRGRDSNSWCELPRTPV